jgi:hypothetical protein
LFHFYLVFISRSESAEAITKDAHVFSLAFT